MTTLHTPTVPATAPGRTHPTMTSLNQRIKGALNAELAQMDAAFDFEAGLADVYARAGLTRLEPAEPSGHAATPAHPGALITSFGYRHGPAPAADLTVDVRQHLHDPHVDPSFRELTGHDAAGRARVLATPGAHGLIEGVTAATGALLLGARTTDAAESTSLSAAPGATTDPSYSPTTSPSNSPSPGGTPKPNASTSANPS
jgi:P-loop ATPase protein family